MGQTQVVPVTSHGPKMTNENQANCNQKTNGGRCMKPGPIVRNPYLNFLRDFRANNCGLSAVETVRRGAASWKTLSEEKRAQYIIAAFYAPRHSRRTRRSGGKSLRLRPARQRRGRRNTSSGKRANRNSRRKKVCARPLPRKSI